MLRKATHTLYLLLFSTWCYAQSFHTLEGFVFDAQEKEPLPFATVRLKSEEGKFYGTTTDENGKFSMTRIESGRYHVTVSYIGYNAHTKTIDLKESTTLTFSLRPSSTSLDEVVVTASESKGITSASKIDRTAMEHLQPTSFTDLLSLLPGGSTQTPNMNKANIIHLREAGAGGSNYNTTSLGTQFIIDGTPINTNADLQAVVSDISGSYNAYNAVNAGVDMRNIPTDNIESVEIIRGIPSVRYNDLTSGVVIIHRKQKATPLEARFKADQYSKLFYAGKGMEYSKKNLTLNADLGYLDSQGDPRDRYKGYKRINTGIRLNKKWMLKEDYTLNWQSNANYSGNIDNVKNDPDIDRLTEDSYRSGFHSGSWHNKIGYTAPQGKAFRRLTLTFSADMSWDQIKRSRFIQLDRDRTTPVYMEAGEHDAEILPYKYTAHVTVDGKPVNFYAKAETEFRVPTGNVLHKIVAGCSYRYAKNFGGGQIYDMKRPLDPMGGYTRPREYRSIPASEQGQFYVEDNLSMPVGTHRLELQAGVGGNMLLNIAGRYALNDHIYFDPRFNAQWKFPGVAVGRHKLMTDLSGGLGWLTMMPTLSQLYPDNIYKDFMQLNYWNANPAYKRINLRTYLVDPVNYNLRAARNFKWEVRLGMEYQKNELSVTYFRERMNSGFRSIATYAPYEYKKYDASHVDGSTLTAPPELEGMPYTPETKLSGYGYTGNGSRTQKEGVEFQFASARFKPINTRFTVNGAWLRTIYENSRPVYKPVSKVVNGVALSDRYIGLYEVDDSYLREQLNTNFIVDTYLEKLGMKLSATVECLWFYSRQTPRRSGTPLVYMDVTGTIYPYTEADKRDLYKQHLVMDYSTALLGKTTEPFYMYVNFKATKDFGKHVSVSLFADRILDYVPDYKQNGFLIRRTAASPYFGMELNIKI